MGPSPIVITEQKVREKSHFGREEEADCALRSTVIRPVWAWILTLAFLAMILAVPALQIAVERRRNPSQLPQPLRLGTLWSPELHDGLRRPLTEPARLLPSAEAIRRYEDDLENGSVLTEWVLPPIQSTLARLGAGNEKAYCGVDGWLFYRPDVDYVTGKGFLSPAVLEARSRQTEGVSVQPNPLPAIVQFSNQLKDRGIELIVMPVPPKPVIEPDKLSPRSTASPQGIQNPSYREFCATLQRSAVRVFDPTGVLIDAKRQSGRPQFLQTDTHWTPEAMERVAIELTDTIRGQKLLPYSRRRDYVRQTETVNNLGDIAMMLKLPQDQRLFNQQSVDIHPVYSADGERWRPSREADVLLLGDSYTSIYSLGGMGWGRGAGLAEELSFALQRPVDRIAINDGGSYTTREELIREYARGQDRLKGKRLVIWQFAMRNLTEGDWRLLDLPTGQSADTNPMELFRGS